MYICTHINADNEKLLTKKGKVRRGMTDKLDKGLPHGLTPGRVRSDDIAKRK